MFTYDDVLETIGDFGRYQKFQYVLLCLVSVVAAFHAFNMVFVGATPEHHCNVDPAVSQGDADVKKFDVDVNISLSTSIFTRHHNNNTVPFLASAPHGVKKFDACVKNTSVCRNVQRFSHW